MPTNSIDAVINLKDNYSNTASKVERSTKGLNNSFQSGANNLKELSKNAEMAEVKLKGLTSSAFAMAAAFESIGKLQNMMSSIVGGAFNYSKMMESNAVGISGILQSMVTVNGKTMEWNQSMRMSQDIMSKLRVEALQTAATSEDLIETFRGILGPGLSQGMNIDEILKFTKVGVNAVRSLGLPSNQYLQELRSILQGNIRPSSSTLATSLGITNQDIKKAKTEVGGVFEFLMKRMEGFDNATEATQRTVEGRIAIVKEAIKSGLRESGKHVYGSIYYLIKDISDMVLVTSEETGRIALNPAFVEGVRKVADNFMYITERVEGLAKAFGDRAGGITQGIMMLATAKIGGAALNSAINGINSFTAKFKQIDTWLKGDMVGEKINELRQAVSLMEKEVNYVDHLAQSNREMGEYLQNINGSVARLAAHYQNMGVDAEKAAQWQKRIQDLIMSGADTSTIAFAREQYEIEAKKIQLLKAEKDVNERIAKIKENRDNALNKMLEAHAKEIESANAKIQKSEDALTKIRTNFEAQNTDVVNKALEKEANLLKKIDELTQQINEKRYALANKYSLEQDKSYAAAMNSARKDNANIYAGGDRSINSVERFGERLKSLGAEEEFITQKINSLNATILSSKGQSLDVVRETVNALMQQAEEEAKATNAVKQQEESKKKLEASVVKVWEGVEKTTREIIRQKVEEEKLAEQARMVRDLQTLPGHYNYNGKEFLWNKDNVKTLNELKQAAEGYGLSQNRINGILNEYIRLTVEVGKKDADRYVQATKAALESTRAKEAELREQQKVAETVEQLKVRFKTLAEVEAEVDLAQRKLYISAGNNIEKLKETNVTAAKTIAKAWGIIENAIGNAEVRAKTEAEYFKVIASGNMALAEKMAIGINNAFTQHPSGQNFNEYVTNNLLKENADLEKKQLELKKLYADYSQTVQDLEAKGIKRTQEETEKLNKAKQHLVDLEKEHEKELEQLSLKVAQQISNEIEKLEKVKQGQSVQKKDIQEINKLTAEQINIQQMAMLMYEASNKARITGDKRAQELVEQLNNAIRVEANLMRKEGKSTTQHYELLMNLLKGVADGTYKLTDAQTKAALANVKYVDSLRDEVEVLEKGDKVKHDTLATIGGVAGAFSSLVFAINLCTDGTDDNIAKLVDWGLKSTAVISAAESMGAAIKSLKGLYDALAVSAARAQLAQMGGKALSYIGGLKGLAAIAGYVGVGAAVTGAGWMLWEGSKTTQKEKQENLSKLLEKSYAEEAKSREKIREDLKARRYKLEEKERLAPFKDILFAHQNESYYNDNDPRQSDEDFSIDLKNKPEEEVDKKAQRAAERAAKEQERLEKQAEKAKASYDELYQSILVANDGFASGITEEEKALDKRNKQVQKWIVKQRELEGAAGDKISKTKKDDMYNLVRIYAELATADAKRAAEARQYSNALQDIQNKETMSLLTTRQANEQRIKVLADQRKEIEDRIALYSGASSKAAELQQKIREAETEEERKRLELEYSYYKENIDKKLQAERDLAENIKQTREAMTTSGKIQWNEIADYVKNITFDQTATVKSGIDTLVGEFTNFGQNIIGSTKSVTEQLKELCKNLTSDILNMMMKIYMQGLMMNLIGSIFGGGGNMFSSKGFNPKGSSIGIGSVSLGGSAMDGLKGSLIGGYASGGVASGWSIVGEKGPELVNFSNPGRVYTADQTAKALSNNGGGVNIKIDLHNESGQQMQAETTGATWDGESWVVGVWLKAFSTNKNGMRNIIKGVATAR